MTKSAICYHPSALHCMIGIKLSSVKRSSSISCRVIITSCGIVEMPDTQTEYVNHHHPILFYRTWCIWGSPLASCGIGTHKTCHGQKLPGLDKNPSVHGLSPTMPRMMCISRQVYSPLELPESHYSHLWDLPFITPHPQYFSTFQTNPKCSTVYPLALICNYLDQGYTCQNTNCVETVW